MAATSILNQQEIAFKIRRMALEIAERNTDAPRLILVGVEPNGTIMSAQIKQLLSEWFTGDVEEISLDLNKRQPTTISLSHTTDFNDAVVVLVDDVANSGKTLTYAIKPLLEYFPRKIQTVVLIDRTHKEFPVKPDYVGLSIATSMEDFIDVEQENGVLMRAIVDQK